MENQFREQHFKTEGSTNGPVLKMTVGSYRQKGGPSKPASDVGALGVWPHPARRRCGYCCSSGLELLHPSPLG